jgi:hypothetical protein
VPPQQCPECGRFLKAAFVTSLTAEPTPCPSCEAGLVAGMFAVNEEGGSVAGPAPAASGLEPAIAPPDMKETGAEHPTTELPSFAGEEASVRPPDLRPDAVRDAAGDVLEGWDRGAGPVMVVDRAPIPTDAIVLAGAGLAGAVLGALFGERGCRGAVLGAAGGVLGAAVARRIWRLE